MAKAAILYSDMTQAATIGGAATVTGLGFDFLKDPQPRHRARVNDTTAYLILDLGSARSFDVAALIGTSLDAAATARLRASASDATVTGSLAYDSGVQSGCTSTAWNGAVIGCLPAAVSARYLRWDLTLAAGPVDIGLAPCGLLFRPARNFGFGGQEGRIDASVRDSNPDTGAEFGLVLPQRRIKQITFPAFTKAEVRGDLDAMDRLVGSAGDVLFVEDPDASWADRARDSIWGSFRQPGAGALATRSYVSVFGRSITLTERI
jgi:hypothetical protein